MVGKLVLFLADGTTLEFPLERDRTTIGRRTGTDLCLPYAAVSGEHAVVVATPNGSTLEDLGSTNGTKVNGERISKHQLRDGDRIDIGRQRIVFLTDPEAVVPSIPRRREQADRRARKPAIRTNPVSAEAPAPEVDAERTLRAAGADASAASGGVAPFTPDAPGAVLPPGPSIKVLTGPNCGRVLPLTRNESLIGRAGTQVAAVRRVGDEFCVFPAEGSSPPSVNARRVTQEGLALQAGDRIEVAGTSLEFLPAEAAPAN